MSSQVSSPSEVDPLSPGAQLRAAREQRGETINEVAFALKLNPRQIVALEENDFEALPGMALVRGFMRNYARHLGIDAAPLLDAVQQMSGGSTVDLSPIRNADGDLPSGAARRRSTRWSGWLVVVLIAAVLAGWYFDWFRTEPVMSEDAAPLSSESQPVEPASPPAEPPAARESSAEPTASMPAAGTDAAAAEAAPPVGSESAAAPAAEAAAADAPASAAAPAASSAVAEGSPAAATAAATATVTENTETAAATPAAEGLSQLAFSFRGESWVEVRDAGGQTILSGINAPGTTRTVQGRPPFALVVGNSAQVGLEHDGKPVNMAAHTKVSVARFNLP